MLVRPTDAVAAAAAAAAGWCADVATSPEHNCCEALLGNVQGVCNCQLRLSGPAHPSHTAAAWWSPPCSCSSSTLFVLTTVKGRFLQTLYLALLSFTILIKVYTISMFLVAKIRFSRLVPNELRQRNLAPHPAPRQLIVEHCNVRSSGQPNWLGVSFMAFD